MHEVVNKIEQCLADTDPQYKSVKYLLAASGGIDSMVLVYACLKLRLNITVAHCNFQLRGYESDEDENFLRAFCEANDLEFLVARFDTAAEKQGGESTQMVARRLRYAWFDQLMEEREFGYVLLAHHLDDQIESFFINFLRGTGIRGLIGMRVLNGNRLRPMLDLTKNDIEQYSNYLEMDYREDSSNREYKYLRNKIRHHLVPLLREARPELYDIFQKNTEKLSMAQEALDKGFEAFFSDLDVANIPTARFLEIPRYYRTRFLSEFGFTASQAQDLLTAGTGAVFYSNSHSLHLDREHFQLAPLAEEVQSEIKILSLEQPTRLDDLELLVTRISGAHVENRIPSRVSISADDVQWPLRARKWMNGDAFVPLGMKGKKKLSDFFIDEKLSRPEKADQWIVENGDGRIVWVVGKRISEEFKIRPETNNTLILETKMR